MIQLDFETEQKTLRVRDAFRVLTWQVYEVHRKPTQLDQVYTQFNSRWNRCRIRSMDLSELTELATEKGFSIEQLLVIRECYYGIAKPYPDNR